MAHIAHKCGRQTNVTDSRIQVRFMNEKWHNWALTITDIAHAHSGVGYHSVQHIKAHSKWVHDKPPFVQNHTTPLLKLHYPKALHDLSKEDLINPEKIKNALDGKKYYTIIALHTDHKVESFYIHLYNHDELEKGANMINNFKEEISKHRHTDWYSPGRG